MKRRKAKKQPKTTGSGSKPYGSMIARLLRPVADPRHISINDLADFPISKRHKGLPFVEAEDFGKPFGEVYRRVFDQEGPGKANYLLIQFGMREEKDGKPGWFVEQEFDEKVEAFGDKQRDVLAEGLMQSETGAEPSFQSFMGTMLPPRVDTGLRELRQQFGEQIDWGDYNVIDIILGAVIVNCAPGDPIFLFVVGPSSMGKTEFLRALSVSQRVHHISAVTPRTFISGYKDPRKKKGTGPDKSLLKKLQAEKVAVLVIKDFTTTLQARAEDRNQIFADLREIADGAITKAFGTGEEVAWEGKLGIIAGVTNVIDKTSAVRQVLGERFLNVRMVPGNVRKMAKKALEKKGKEDKWRKTFQETVGKFFRNLKVDLDEITISAEIGEKLESIGIIVAEARTGVERDRSTKVVETLPTPEGPGRLVGQFATLAKGIAGVQGKTTVDEEVLDRIRKVARDTLPDTRNRVLQAMWETRVFGETWEKTETLSQMLGCKPATLSLWLDDLEELKLVEGKLEGAYAVHQTHWKLSEKAKELIESSGIYGKKAELIPLPTGFNSFTQSTIG